MRGLYYFCKMFYSYICQRHPFAGRLTRIIVSLLFLLCWSTTVLRAQNDKRAHYQLLWRIDGPGLSAPSYLFGTMHLTDSRVFEFSDSVLAALRRTSSFAMEVDMDSMMSYMLAPGGPLLDTVNHMRRLLTAEEYRYVDSLVIQKTGGSIAQLSLKRLWFIEKLLLDEEKALKKSADPDQKAGDIFLDGWLHQKATGLGKPVYSLERIQNQLHMMSADVSEVQKEVFLWNLGYHDEGSGDAEEKADRFNARVSMLDSLVNLYYGADLQKISALVNNWDDTDGGPGLEFRNREMTNNLALLMPKGSVFAAVGVAHLPGEKGMLSLLRTKGFTVTAVNAAFTGVARRERQRLDSLKGYLLNRIADGYSVNLPGTPITYPVPNSNRKMYLGNNEEETCFAFSVDIAQLGMDKKEMVNMMLNNMAKQGNAELKKSYPIIYRDIPGTEAVLLQEKLPFYVRLFIHNNRAFVFMHSAPEKDSSLRKDFFRSIRFYDIARTVMAYDTISRPQLGFSAVMPSDVSYIKTQSKQEVRPEEVWSGLDNTANISYVLRVEKMQRGYYNTDDKKMLKDLRNLLVKQDSTLQLIDSTVTERAGLPVYRFTYRHGSGFISRMQYIPRGNIAYCQFCTYDHVRTDSSYWKRFLDDFQLLPLQAKAPVIPFVPADSSFTINGPETFVGGPLGNYNESSPGNVYYYTAMDSGSHAMYIAEVDRYSHYYHNDPDSILKIFIHPVDTAFTVVSHRQSVWEGMPVYETEMKSRATALRWYRKAIVAGHTVYRLSAIMPGEIVKTDYARQFFATFRPGNREKADTFRLQQKKLLMLLADLQSKDTTVFNGASAYVGNLVPDSTDKAAIINALAKPFPADTGESNAKVELLLSLKKLGGDDVVHAAEQMFTDTTDRTKQARVLQFLTSLATDTAVRTFLRLAQEMPDEAEGNNIFSYAFKRNSLYPQYIPAMIATARQSKSFLQAFAAYTSRDSLWISRQYGVEGLLPDVISLFERQVKAWKNRSNDSDNEWKWRSRILNTSYILVSPGMPAAAAASFRQLLTDTVMPVRALAARGLINRGIKVDDKTLSSILNDLGESYLFIHSVKKDKQLSHIRHLLNQELVGRSYVASYVSEDYEVSAIEQVTRVKVPQGKQPAVWLALYRYKTEDSEDWEYVLNGPLDADPLKLRFELPLMHWIREEGIVTDKKKLSAAAAEAYKNYLEREKED
jgi:uncharacterized protein YbaP (TraB family)